MQKWVNIGRLSGTLPLVMFIFFAPYILLFLAGWINHYIGGIIAEAFKLSGFIKSTVEWILVPCSTMLFLHPIIETYFKRDNNLDSFEKRKLLALLIAPGVGYSMMILSYLYGVFVSGVITHTEIEVVFMVGFVLIGAGAEIGAGVVVLPSLKLIFSEMGNGGSKASSSTKSSTSSTSSSSSPSPSTAPESPEKPG